MKNNKRFVLSALAFAVTLALVSCKPLQGHAVEIDIGEQTGIYDYLDTAGENMQQIDFSLDSDQDGNRSIRLKIYGLQKLALTEQTSFYDNLDFGSAPDSVTVSGSGCSALYRNGTTNEIQPVTLSLTTSSSALGTHPFVSAPDYVFSFTSTGDSNATYRFTLSSTNSYNTLYTLYSSGIYSGSYTERVFSPTGLFPEIQRVLSTPVSFSYTYYVENNTIPTITNFGRFDQQTIGGLGQNVSLPSGSIDTQAPWDYYNNVLLPYMEEEFPGFDDYFIFPDGYNPPAQPSTVPVEYPTLPGFDLALETNGTQPASDYAYNIPEMPTKDIAVPSFDFSNINPAEVMAPVAEHLRSMWALITGVLTEFGLFPYVAIAVFAAIVAGLLRLGK